jgi:hypothetical protein
MKGGAERGSSKPRLPFACVFAIRFAQAAGPARGKEEIFP